MAASNQHIIARHCVPELPGPQRLSDYCRELFAELPSRKSVKKAILAGRILLNEQIGATGDWVHTDDQIALLAPEPKTRKVYEMPLEVVMETADWAIVNKPGGLPVSGPQFRTLVHVLPYNLSPSGKKDALAQPYPLHRLDSPTSGLVLVAKTASAHLHLGSLFAERQITKIYQAIVTGETAEKGSFDQAIEGKTALSRFERIATGKSIKNGQLSWLKLYPETGRTHQLRIHLAQAGHSVMGDQLYGIAGQVYKGQGLFLCATGLHFTDPFSGTQIAAAINPPSKYRKLLQREAKMWSNKRLG